MNGRDRRGLEGRRAFAQGRGRAGLALRPLQLGKQIRWYRHGRGPALSLEQSLLLLAALVVAVAAGLWLRQG